MEFFKENAGKIRTQLAGKTDMVQKTIITALILVLVITICIFSKGVANIQGEYTHARNELGGSIYSHLYEMYIAYQGADQPGADMLNDILPNMESNYYAAQTLDDAIARCFGTQYQVLTATVRSAFNDAFGAYENAYRMGKSTATAQESMRACMTSLESIMLTRFDNRSVVLPLK